MRNMVVHTHGLCSPLPNMRFRMDSQWLLSMQWVDLRSFTTAPSFRALNHAQDWVLQWMALHPGFRFAGTLSPQIFSSQNYSMILRNLKTWVLDTEHVNFAKKSEYSGPSNYVVM